MTTRWQTAAEALRFANMTDPFSKTQVDKLGSRLRSGPPSKDDIRALDAYRRAFASPYEATVEALRTRLSVIPTGRPAKSTSSIVEKLRRETIRLSQIQDIAGCRVVTEDAISQDAMVDQLITIFPRANVVDRRKTPSSGYRAVHVVVEQDGRSVEIQVRTALQHLWAEVSEKLADLVDPAVKYGGGPTKLQELLVSSSDLVALSEGLDRQVGALADKIAPLVRSMNDLDTSLERYTPAQQRSSPKLQEALTSAKEVRAQVRQLESDLAKRKRTAAEKRRAVSDILQQLASVFPRTMEE